MDTRVWQKYRPDRAVVTVTQLYKSVDELGHRLHRGKPLREELKEQSAAAPLALKAILEEHTRADSPLVLGNQALEALELGMVTGLVDALRLEDSGPWEEDAPDIVGEPLVSSWKTLWSNLNDARRVADSNWRKMEREDLHLLWEYGRHQNLDTLEQAVRFQGKPDLEFQVFLMATFKAGYAVAMAQGVWQFCYLS